MNTGELYRLVNAYKVISDAQLSEQEARQQLDHATTLQRWVAAEHSWKYRIREWLTAEGKYLLRQRVLDEPTYAAGRRGWTAMKGYVPGLDGVEQFEQLPDSLQFRYAAFAAAALGTLPPAEVKSGAQISREIASDDAIPRFGEEEF